MAYAWICIARTFDLANHVDYYSYNMEEPMRTIQMTLDDDLVAAVDVIIKKLKTTRSAFTRKALRDALLQNNIEQLEKRHKKGYERHPISKAELSVWESEQEWGDQ